jgi:uncharacterized protein (DUF1778 family)
MYQQARDQVSEDGRLRETEMAEPGKNVKNPETPRLSARQERALLALLSSPNVEAAAEKAGCSERSIRGWLSSHEPFKSAYRQARRAIMDQAILVLQKAYSDAVAELVQELNSGNEHIRHKAAVAILDRADKWVQTESLESRLSALEAKLGEELGEQARSARNGYSRPLQR